MSQELKRVKINGTVGANVVAPGDVVGDPKRAWVQSTAEEYIDSEIEKVKNWVSNTPVTDVSILTQLPASGDVNTLYRVAGTNAYSEYGWDGTQFVKLDEKEYGIDDEPTAGSENLVKSEGIARNRYIFSDKLPKFSTLNLTTWDGNATITDVSTNLMGITENLRKVDFNILNASANTIGFDFRYNGQIHEDDIINLVACIYTEDTTERKYFLSVNTNYPAGSFTFDSPIICSIKSGFNYFYFSMRSNITVTPTQSQYFQVVFKDNTLDGKTWYVKAYKYIGTPHQNMFLGVDSEPTSGSDNIVKSGGVYNFLNFFGLVERNNLAWESWENNAEATLVTSNIMGKAEEIWKLDFHINAPNASTFAFRFQNPEAIDVTAGDILNFALCIYVSASIEKTYNLNVYSNFTDGSYTPLTPKVLYVKTGFNYFVYSVKINTSLTLAKNKVFELYFKDNTLDASTWYYKAYWYWGTPNQRLLTPLDNTLVENSKNLVRSGDIKNYVDGNISEANRELKYNIFYYLNSDTLRIELSGNNGYTLTKYDKYYSVSYNHVDGAGYSVGNILLGYAKNFRNGNRIYIRYDVKVFSEAHIIKVIPGQWGSSNRIGDGNVSIKSIYGGYYVDYSQSVLDAIDNLSDNTPIVFAFGINDGNSTQYDAYDGETGVFKVSSVKPEKFTYEEDEILRVDAVEERVEDIEEQIGLNKIVVCWGDSLTAGAGSGDETNAATVKAVIEAKGYTLSSQTYNYVTMLQALLGGNYSVLNCGVGGENIDAISARQGGNLAVFSDTVELPTDTSVVNVSRPISSFDRSSMVNVLLQRDIYVNPCYVQGIPCTLSVTYDAGYTNVQYRLNRNEAGDRDVTLPQYTPIVMQGSKLNPATEIAVLWCWQNGGYSTNGELVEKLKNMISHLHTTKYLLIGLHSRSFSSGNVQEALLEKTFGDKFFNWRQYASTNALYDFGITPTTEDITAMGTGSMPPSLLSDAVHMNSAGYMILGWKLYERMKNVGYID